MLYCYCQEDRKEEKMKRKNHKKIIFIVLGILAIMILAKWSSEYTKQQMISCIEGGNTEKFCEYHLGK